jgi:thioredoxin reductase (NADPH)
MIDVLIVGAGCAGLTASIYVARAGKSALVLESESFGGQIVTSAEVENFPSIKSISGYDFAKNLMDQALALGVEIESDRITALEKEDGYIRAIGEDAKYKAKSVIIATGAKKRKLGLPEEAKYVGAGVSYCALCDGAFFLCKTVAVNGGGSTALEEALYLAEKCKKVYLIHRRADFRGERRLASCAEQKENIEFVLNSKIACLKGEKRLETIEVADVNTHETRELSVACVFVSIGNAPDNSFLAGQIKLDEHGYIIAVEDCKTNLDGVFTAGDCRTKEVRQLTTAAADGTVAAVNACNYLNEGPNA